MANMNPVCWFEIYVDDMQRASRFYETVLKITLDELPSPEGFEGTMKSFQGNPEGMNANGALVKHAMNKPSANGTIVYFGCEDCSVEQSRVESAGGKVLMPKFSIGEYGFCALIADTEGNTVGLFSMT